MRAHADTAAMNPRVESKLPPQRRSYAIGCHNKWGAKLAPSCAQPNDFAPIENGGFNSCTGVRANAPRRGGGFEQCLIEVSPADPATLRNNPAMGWESSFVDLTAEVVAHAAKSCAADSFTQAHAFEDGYSGRHETLAAGLLAWECVALEKFDAQAQPTE
jgi:hypothetical protein